MAAVNEYKMDTIIWTKKYGFEFVDVDEYFEISINLVPCLFYQCLWLFIENKN